MQLRYWSIVDWQAAWGSAALEKSMHSSRLAFSSLQTQQGFGLEAASAVEDEAWAAEAPVVREGNDTCCADMLRLCGMDLLSDQRENNSF